ncbi:TIGR02594 family protein (plasmid) [Rhizobium lusitanum]|uniref:NlpC/P60 family protein n=1 Tax=Rhizobium lusitanum TaxID=293958 RepID=UPI0016213804|nr:TIGR02594 family protein [Rhizobium lusitanum]QND45218.1 TIGR02594 family protein [Rhizobium lusitanum]
MTFDEWLVARLTARGFYSGTAKQATARDISIAVSAFQQANGIKATGTATPETVAALRQSGTSSVSPAAPTAPAEPTWMREARRFMGLKEIAGAKSNSTIIGWAKALGGWIATFYTNDDTPWCGLFIGHCISASLPSERLPANPLGALNWSDFGKSVKTPARGAILTFHRDGGGHVGLYVGEDSTAYHVLGGNQSNSVSITRVDKGRLDDIRWPLTGEEPVGGRVLMAVNGTLSKNEA